MAMDDTPWVLPHGNKMPKFVLLVGLSGSFLQITSTPLQCVFSVQTSCRRIKKHSIAVHITVETYLYFREKKDFTHSSLERQTDFSMTEMDSTKASLSKVESNIFCLIHFY